MLGLRRPSTALVASYLDAIAEMRELGETIWDGWVPRASESPSEFVQRLVRAEHSPDAGKVPESVYWAVSDRANGAVVGRITLRHRLNANLERFGGHVGYEVRPSFRRRGIGKEMLRQLLELPEARAIGRLLVTCAPENVASNKTIVANGGVLDRTELVAEWSRLTSYYWIDLR